MRGSSNYVKFTGLIRFNFTEVRINKTNTIACYSQVSTAILNNTWHELLL